MTEQFDASLDYAALVSLAAGSELPRPRNVEEILAIAYTMERESATRYGDLAKCMTLLGRADLAALFADLAREEQHHLAEVKGLAQRVLRRMPAWPSFSSGGCRRRSAPRSGRSSPGL